MLHLLETTEMGHNLTLAVWHWENAFWHGTVPVRVVVVNLNVVLWLQLHQIELIVSLQHHLLPISIVVVLARFSEFWTQEFRTNIFLIF